MTLMITPDILQSIPRIFILISLAAAAYAGGKDWVPSNDKPRCECKDAEALAVDLANAVKLGKAYAQESRTLSTQYGKNETDKSIEAEGTFTAKTAPTLVQTVPGLTGEVATTFVPEGTTTGTGRPISKEQQCNPNDRSKDDLQRDVDNSVCKAMAQADIAHEQYHWNQCRTDGFNRYWHGTSGAARALEESRAYDTEAKVLKKELKELCERCKPQGGCDKPPCRSALFKLPEEPWCTKAALEGGYSKP